MGKEFLLCCFLLVWKRALTFNNDSTLQHQTSVTFTEGGLVNISSRINTTGDVLNVNEEYNNIVMTPPRLPNQTEDMDLPKNGTVKARKGVHEFKIVPRKGAPPCLAETSNSTEDIGCSTTVQKSGESLEGTETLSTKVFDAIDTSSGKGGITDSVSSIADKPSSTTTTTTPVSKKITHLKPSVTVVPSDSTKILQSLPNDRNVVIPVVALVCVPLVVLLVLLIRKRYQDARGSSYYERMGFLIEDIYND